MSAPSLPPAPAADPLQGTSHRPAAPLSLSLSNANALEHSPGSAQPSEQEQQFLIECDLSVPPEPNSPLLDTQGSLFEQPLSPPELAAFTDSEPDIQQQAEFSPPVSPPPLDPLPRQATLDLTKPIEDQGPLDVIIHKLTDVILEADQNDSQSLELVYRFQEYIDAHPETIILDPLPAIRTLLDRSKSYELIRRIEAYMQVLRATESSECNSNAYRLVVSAGLKKIVR
ncbi:Inositol-tetrakisphosphate 1-kinase [Chelonia mydas]|uniref:Inositol-tetrakisphosphate 1-kinase n=1 Tax=Chelonia mydas TaxID=8469 RepID=M7BVP1_CHEMY|nr:Inositol-tetrakisphosphate 1-kinase [Chelonia mydas]